MKLSKTTRTLIASLGLGFALVGGSAMANTKIVMSNDNNAFGLKGKTFEVLKKEIEQRMGDDVSIQLSHGGTLFDQQDQLQGLQLGSVNIIAPTSGIYGSLAPKVGVFSLPFMFSDPEQIQKALENDTIRSAFVPTLQKKNIEPIAIWLNGPRDISYIGKKAILEPSDMKGVKIRVQDIKTDIATMKQLGANVVSMGWSEVPTALQQGVIDAVEPTPNALVGAGLDEVITQMTKVHYKWSFYIVAANKQWWDGLSDDVRSKIQESLDAATQWNLKHAAQVNQTAYDKLQKEGKKVHELTPEQRQDWVKAVAPIWERFGDKLVGEDVMDAFKKVTGAKEN